MAWRVVLFSLAIVPSAAWHPLKTFGLGFWREVPQDSVGLVYKNGALRDDTLAPGLHFLPGAYTGTIVRDFGVLEDIDCFGCEHKLLVKSQEGTEWLVAVNVANQVVAENAVSVVKAQGTDYDSKMGRLMPSVLKEVFAPLTNLEIRKDKATELNELAETELKGQIAGNWGADVSTMLRVNYLTIEHIECRDKSLRAQWDAQVEEDAKRVTTNMRAKTEAADHARQQASVVAAAERQAAETVAQAERAELEAAAQNARLVASAASSAQIKGIEDTARIATATAEAQADRIKADQTLHAATNEAELIKSNPAAAAHKATLEGYQAVYNNAKHTILVPNDGGGVLGLGTILQSVFGN